MHACSHYCLQSLVNESCYDLRSTTNLAISHAYPHFVSLQSKARLPALSHCHCCCAFSAAAAAHRRQTHWCADRRDNVML